MDQLRSLHSHNWDTNGDGKVSMEELRKEYDTNSDGKLDDQELTNLANQLSTQTTYTNKLLSQLQSLEEQSLKQQQEAQTRETTLRRAMEAMDQARADANMLRSRLQNANDLIDQHRRGEHDQMAQGHERDRQVGALQKIVDQQAHDLDSANSEVVDSRATLDRLQRSHAEAQNELDEQKRKRAEETARFQVAAEETLREKRLLESKLAPIAQENIGLSEALAKSTARASACSSELQSTKTQVHALQRRIAELEQNEIALNDKNLQYQNIDRKRISTLTSLERKYKDASETCLGWKDRYEKCRDECHSVNNENVLIKDQFMNVTKELEATQKGAVFFVFCVLFLNW